MSENDLPPLPSDLASLLDAEKARPEPAGMAQDRLLSRLDASIASLPHGPGDGGGDGGDTGGGGHGAPGHGASGSGGTAATGASAGSGGTAATGAALSAKATVGASLLAKPIALAAATFALGGALGAAVDHAAVRPEPPRTRIVYVDRVLPAAQPTVRAPAPDESISPTSSALPRPRPMPTASAAPAASDVTPGHDAQLAGERALLEIARTALGKGDSAAALDALAKHASRYPRGQMSEEREALAVEALAGAGRMDEARSRGARFRRDFPNSMLMPVVDSALK